MNRRDFLKNALLSAPVLATISHDQARGAPPLPERPNFVLVNVDDLGWTDLACFGSTFYETPNLDKLAKEGLKFTDAYAACAVCSPTRAAIVTGRYPARTGVTDWIRARFQGGGTSEKDRPPEYVKPNPKHKAICPSNPYWLERDEVTLAEALKPAGYVSCHIGKWHLGPDDWYPQKQGFDVNIGGCDYGQPPSYYDPYTNKRLTQGIPGLPSRKEGEFLTDREGDEAVRFLTANKDNRFLLYYCPYAVHTPIQAHKDLVGKYQEKPKTNQKNAAYASMVESVDIAVGKIVKVLDDLGLAEKTLVIFTSDNGGLLGPTNNTPLRSGKGNPYEGGIRIPQIARWKGVVKPGSTSSVPVTSVDFFPTFCALAGVDLPKRPIDGTSLVPILTDGGTIDRDAIYWHFPHYRGGIMPYSIVRNGDWKLIKRYDGKPFELFNLRNDLSETTDLAEKEPDRVRKLDAQLVAWLRSANAKVPKPNPDYKPKGEK